MFVSGTLFRAGYREGKFGEREGVTKEYCKTSRTPGESLKNAEQNFQSSKISRTNAKSLKNAEQNSLSSWLSTDSSAHRAPQYRAAARAGSSESLACDSSESPP